MKQSNEIESVDSQLQQKKLQQEWSELKQRVLTIEKETINQIEKI